MAMPNKGARGTGSSKESRAAAAKRQASEDFVRDMGRFQRGEMSAEDFRAKYDPGASA